MTTLVYPWSIRQGIDFPFVAIWSAGAPVLPVGLSGCTATCMIRQLPTDASPLVSISTTPNAQGSIVLGATNGTITVSVTRAATLALPAGFLGGANSVESLWLQWNLDILFPANASFPSGQAWSFGRGPVSVIASVDY